MQALTTVRILSYKNHPLYPRKFVIHDTTNYETAITSALATINTFHNEQCVGFGTSGNWVWEIRTCDLDYCSQPHLPHQHRAKISSLLLQSGKKFFGGRQHRGSFTSNHPEKQERKKE